MGSHSGWPSSRWPGSLMANSTRADEPGSVATFAAYCSGVKTCSSKPASCTSPNTPRVFTLVSTRFSEPTSRARFCISPRPLCTCSRRSATCLKLSPSRCSSVACSFSSTVARICSSFFSLSCWMAGEALLHGQPQLGQALLVGLGQGLQLLAHRIVGQASAWPRSGPARCAGQRRPGIRGRPGPAGTRDWLLPCKALGSAPAGTGPGLAVTPGGFQLPLRPSSSRSSRSRRSLPCCSSSGEHRRMGLLASLGQRKHQQDQGSRPSSNRSNRLIRVLWRGGLASRGA